MGFPWGPAAPMCFDKLSQHSTAITLQATISHHTHGRVWRYTQNNQGQNAHCHRPAACAVMPVITAHTRA